MNASTFDPRREVSRIGLRAEKAVALASNGAEWTPATIRAASDALQSKAPRLAKRLHTLAAIWAVNYRGVRA